MGGIELRNDFSPHGPIARFFHRLLLRPGARILSGQGLLRAVRPALGGFSLENEVYEPAGTLSNRVT
jgi:hypothetical protein